MSEGESHRQQKLPRRHRFSPSSTEFKAALGLVFKKQEQTVRVSPGLTKHRGQQCGQRRPGQDRTTRSGEQAGSGRKWTHTAEWRQTGLGEETGHLTQWGTVGISHSGKWYCPVNYHTSQPGTVLSQTWSKNWRRGVLETNTHTGYEKKTKIWCRTTGRQAK